MLIEEHLKITERNEILSITVNKYAHLFIRVLI